MATRFGGLRTMIQDIEDERLKMMDAALRLRGFMFDIHGEHSDEHKAADLLVQRVKEFYAQGGDRDGLGKA